MSLATKLAFIPNITTNYIPRATATGFVNGMVYDDGTNVGIGTSSPSNKLTISNNGNAAVAFRINDTNANASFISMNASNTDAAIIAGGTSAIPFDIYTGGAARFRVSATGNVGIGTSSPSDRLQVLGSLRWGSATNNIVTSNDSGGVYMELAGTSTATRVLRIQGINDAANRYTSIRLEAGAEQIAFVTADAERMRITNGGAVLVGTTAAVTGYQFRVSGGFVSDRNSLNGFLHGRKFFEAGPTSSFVIDLPAAFPGMGLSAGNVWGVSGVATLFNAGNAEQRRFNICRNSGGSWASPSYDTGSQTSVGYLAFVSGSGNNLTIGMTANSYVSLELVVMAR